MYVLQVTGKIDIYYLASLLQFVFRVIRDDVCYSVSLLILGEGDDPQRPW